MSTAAEQKALDALKRVSQSTIGAAPGGGDGMAIYFCERVEQGRGYGEETRPPVVFGDWSNQPSKEQIQLDEVVEALAPEIAKVLALADGGCRVCAEELAEEMSAVLPGPDWGSLVAEAIE
jgi:hypothetical protein